MGGALAEPKMLLFCGLSTVGCQFDVGFDVANIAIRDLPILRLQKWHTSRAYVY